MKKLEIKNDSYYKILVGILFVLIVYNIYSIIITKKVTGILPALIQSVLIYLLFIKHEKSQIIVKIWVIIACFISQGLVISGITIKAMVSENAFDLLFSNKVAYSLILVLSGVVILTLNRNFGEVIEIEESIPAVTKDFE